MKPTLLIIIIHLLIVQATAQLNEKSVFHANQSPNRYWHSYKDNHRALYGIITDEAFKLLDDRDEKVSKYNTADDWKAHQDKSYNALCGSLQKFSKGPLNAKITGTIEKEKFTVEKVILESQPGFYITAALFLPKKRQTPAPAVIYACGHTELGFRSETYQHVILNLVDKGFIVLAFDPLGQGERLQYYDKETDKSLAGGSTKEHSYAGVQTLLTGTSLTDYFIWDGIRVVDYLETRKEVDMKRIGITGRSGGGTQAALIAAGDKRIYAAAPENYITNFRRLLQSIGPQDAEQNPWQAIAKGIDHADFLHIHAPKPALMLTTTHDFFSIQGARETYAEVRRSYTALGKPENIQMTEDAGGHQSTQKNRETLYSFFQKHLNLPGDPADIDVKKFSVKELQVTPTGQLSNSFPGETVYSLNKKYKDKIKSETAKNKKQKSLPSNIDFSRKLTAAVYTGKFIENNVLVEKYFLENNRMDYAVPVYIFKNPEKNSDKQIVWFHPKGKNGLLNEGLLKPLLENGFTIVAADLPGIGELHDPEFTGDGVIQGIPFNYTFGANLVGKSISEIQAEAIDLLHNFTENKEDLAQGEIYYLVQETSAAPFLLYTLNNQKTNKIFFYNLPQPFSNLVEEQYYDPEVAFAVVPGSLPYFDLPQMIQQLSESGIPVSQNKRAETGKSAGNEVLLEIVQFFKR